MKIITWNCNGKFREKFVDILEEDADIYVIQECEDPSQANNEDYLNFAGDNYFWHSNNKDKGLGIFAKDDVKLEKIPDLNEEFEYFIALKVNDSFNLLGVWTMKPYVEGFHDYFDANKELFDENLIICGDFNSNAIWDNLHKTKDADGNDKNQTNLVLKLEDSNLVSAYHDLNDEKQGEETQATFFMYRHDDKPYHIDQIFASEGRVKELDIGNPDKWLELSDHLPLIFKI